MPSHVELVAALMRPLQRLVPHIERLLGAPRSDEGLPATPAAAEPGSASEEWRPAPRASAGTVPRLVAAPRAVRAEVSRDHGDRPRPPGSMTMPPVVASDPLPAGPAPAAGVGADARTSAPRLERSTPGTVVPGLVRRLRAGPPRTIQAREPAPEARAAVDVAATLASRAVLAAPGVAAASPTAAPASLTRAVVIAAAPAALAPAPPIAAAPSRTSPAPTSASSQPSRAMLPFPIFRQPSPTAERPVASWARLPRDAEPPPTAPIPVLRVGPRPAPGASQEAASASDTLEPRRLDPVQPPLDREALEDALADILRDAARREGLEV